MPVFRKALLAGAVALACTGPAAAQWSGFWFLGDSSTDAGFYNGARFTVNPGLVWAQQLGGFYGATITPVTTGGTDLAQGGSRVALPSSLVPAGAPQRPLAAQVSQLLQATPALDPNAVYAIGIGYNDLLENVQAAAAGQITAAQVQANVATAAGQYVQEVARLQQAGARNLVVLNLYNMGQSPLGTSQPAAPFSALTGLFNSTLQSGLDQLGGNVVRVDVQGLFADMLAHPATYGFTNTSVPACTTGSALQCTTNTLVAPGAASTFLFADGIHPTPAAHLAMAQVVDSMLTAPFKAGTLTEGPLAVEQATFRTVDDRMWSALGTPYDAQRGMTFWAAYDYANPDLDTGFAGGDADLHTISVGGDMRLSQHLLAGAAANFSTFKASYAGGRHKLEETSGTIYAGWGNGPWYAGVSALVGTLDYADVSRTFDLGIAQRTEGGDTGGTHWGVRVHGGYWMQAGALVHGPFAKLVWQRADVDAFAEAGGTSTALRYAEQVRKSLVGSVGWQAQGSFGAVRPFGRVTWEHEFKDDAREVAASPIGLGGTYAMTLPKPDGDWALVHVGAAMDFGAPSATFGKLTGFLAATATAGKDDGDSWGLTLGLRVPF